jgi:predicted Fe-S protein YdhL (DUF1289 family)
MNTPSPCNHVCRLDDQNVCLGCLRTRAEIARWSQMNDAEKSAVWTALDERQKICSRQPAIIS